MAILFVLLTDTKDFLEKLCKQAEENLMDEKPLLNCYFRSLAYFQETFQPEIQLLEPDHYERILNSFSFSYYFNKIRNDFLNECDFSYTKFTNELDEIEFEKVASFKSCQRTIEGGRNHKYLLIGNIILLKLLLLKK